MPSLNKTERIRRKAVTTPPSPEFTPGEQAAQPVEALPAEEPDSPAIGVATPHPQYGHPVPPTNHLPAPGPPQDPSMGEKTLAWADWKARQTV